MPRSSETIKINNRFAPLSVEETEETEDNIGNTANGADNNKGKTKPPPVVIAGRPDDKRKFVTFIKGIVQHKFHLDYNGQNTLVKLENESDRKKLMDYLKNEKTGFYTYTPKTEKTHAFVVRGLDAEPPTEEIKMELKEAGIEVQNIYRMNKTRRPLYLVVTAAKHTLKEVSEKARYLDYCKVAWERHNNKRGTVQCHRCQQWGHATSNCYMAVRCLKCAEDHWTHTCTKTAETPATCTNCGGPHPANDTGCPAYERHMAARQRQSTNQQQRHLAAAPPTQRYVPAPPPPTNYWHERAAARAATLTTPQSVASNQPIIIAPAPAPQQRPPQRSSSSTFADMCQAQQKLSSVINISNMLKAINDLYETIKDCHTPAEKFTKTLNFIENVHKYDI